MNIWLIPTAMLYTKLVANICIQFDI